ncbi:MAG: NTP transferase domain-containing protein [Ectobacillus sp.]
MNIIGLYLAAGAGKRMKTAVHKLCLPVGDKPLGSIALQTAFSSQLSSIIVVTNETDWLLPHFYGERLIILSCEQASLGQAYSLRCGLEKAESLQADAVLVMLADQPFIPKQIINDILHNYRREPENAYIASCHQGIPRPPVLLSRSVFSLLKQLQGDQGARSIFNNPFITGKLLSYEDPKWFYDVDTPENYKTICRQPTSFL